MSFPDLRALVLDRYKSIHAFCTAHPTLKRSTVYAVLAGRYPGNSEKQAATIRAVVLERQDEPEGQAAPGASRAEVADALQNIRCNHCRRLDRRNCFECRAQTEREARELYTTLFPGR